MIAVSDKRSHRCGQTAARSWWTIMPPTLDIPERIHTFWPIPTMTPWCLGLPTIDGKTDRGASSPANPACTYHSDRFLHTFLLTNDHSLGHYLHHARPVVADDCWDLSFIAHIPPEPFCCPTYTLEWSGSVGYTETETPVPWSRSTLAQPPILQSRRISSILHECWQDGRYPWTVEPIERS